MANADVAVVVPVYNRASLVLETLNGVARQSMLPRRLLVVDDGSTDGTAEAVADWLRTTKPPFEALLIRQPQNGGVSTARNRGMALARDCRFIAFLDSDDLWPADFIERASNTLAASPTAVAATSDRLDVVVGSEEKRFSDSRPMTESTTCWLFDHDAGIVPATMMTTEKVLEVGGFDERLPTGQDTDLFLSLSLLGKWLHVPGSPVIIRHFPTHGGAEPVHLAEKYPDNQRRWAQIHEDFIAHKGGKRVVPRRVYTRRLANRWSCAAHQLMQAGRTAEARRCLRRSLAWRPWRTSVWSRLMKTYAAVNPNV